MATSYSAGQLTFKEKDMKPGFVNQMYRAGICFSNGEFPGDLVSLPQIVNDDKYFKPEGFWHILSPMGGMFVEDTWEIRHKDGRTWIYDLNTGALVG